MALLFDSRALSLFCQKANLVSILDEAQHADLMQICSWLEGDPLALEWAAMHTAISNPRRTRRVLETALWTHSEPLPSRQDILKAALGCALASLPDSLRRFAYAVSVFEEGWSLEAASVICKESQAEKYCEELLRRQLISCDPSRPEGGYRLENWVRERLRADVGEATMLRLQEAHKAYFFSLACQAAPHLRFTPDTAWVQRLEPDRANLLAAFERSRDTECLKFGLALWRWGYVCAHIQEACRLLHIARFACKTFPIESKPEMYRALGSIFYRKKEYKIARSHLEEAYHIALEQGNWEEAAFSAQMLVIMHNKKGRLDEANQWANASLLLWQKAGLLWGQGSILNEKGVSAWRQNHLAEANQHFLESLDIWIQMNDKHQSALLLDNIGILAGTQQEYKRAEKAFRQSLQYSESNLNKRGVCHTLNNIGVMCYKQQKYRQATAVFCKSLVLIHKIAFHSHLPAVLVGMGETAYRQGKGKLAVLCISHAEYLEPNYKDDFCDVDRQELEHILVKLRRSIRPQLYESLCIRGRKMTIDALLTCFAR